ncbi:MAG TPA: hypothetical protein VLE73_05200 [Candidatus Saccharimonadales bacterium]|nr:hypothetical protein [Candidatus Saccharimonadales bacterium]
MKIPAQLKAVAEGAYRFAWEFTEGRLPPAQYELFAHLYLGAQAVLGGCEMFAVEAPISPAEQRFIRNAARLALAPPPAFSDPTAQSHNLALHERHLGTKKYLTADNSTHFDLACQKVANNLMPSVAYSGLVVENSAFGRKGAGFVSDRERFPAKGIANEVFGITTGALMQQSYARRMGEAVSTAAYHHYNKGVVGGFLTHRHQPTAITNLALVYSVSAVARSRLLAEKAGEMFRPSLAEAYHIRRIGELVATNGRAGPHGNELHPRFFQAGVGIGESFGHYTQRGSLSYLADTTSFYEDTIPFMPPMFSGKPDPSGSM